MSNVKIVGTGSYVPQNVVTNDDLAKIVDTNDEWISSRTGIKQRRITIDENTSDLAYKAALKALENSNEKAENIDLIICATSSPDFLTPSTACIIQSKLGAKNAVAFDISAACTGLIYGMIIAQQFIKTKMYNTILVIGSETLSKILNWKDRSTCVLFGDGASAVILKSSEEENSFLSTHWEADGTKWNYLQCPSSKIIDIYSPQYESQNFISMLGSDVFKFAVKSFIKGVKTVLDKSNCSKDDIKYIIPHQANMRIINYAAKVLKMPMDKFYTNLDKYGNTSAASIGIALDEVVDKGLLNKGDKLILVAFGAGMTSGAILLEWL